MIDYYPQGRIYLRKRGEHGGNKVRDVLYYIVSLRAALRSARKNVSEGTVLVAVYCVSTSTEVAYDFYIRGLESHCSDCRCLFQALSGAERYGKRVVAA